MTDKERNMKWINAKDRLPDLKNDKGIVIVNRKHEWAKIWVPSNEELSFYVTEDGFWALDQYEWLEEFKQ